MASLRVSDFKQPGGVPQRTDEIHDPATHVGVSRQPKQPMPASKLEGWLLEKRVAAKLKEGAVRDEILDQPRVVLRDGPVPDGAESCLGKPPDFRAVVDKRVVASKASEEP